MRRTDNEPREERKKEGEQDQGQSFGGFRNQNAGRQFGAGGGDAPRAGAPVFTNSGRARRDAGE